MSTTKFSFLTKGLNLRQIDSCAVWFSQCALKCLHVSDLTTYFKEIYNCAFDFEVFLALYNKAPISSSAQNVLALYLSNRTVGHSFLHKL